VNEATALAHGDESQLTLWPVLLVPVQIQTRFGTRGQQAVLRLRIYPDQFSIDTHDPRLTQDEVDAGTLFWTSTWRAGQQDGEGQRAIWGRLVDAYGPRRAAWVARDLTPANVANWPVQPTPDGQPLNPAPQIPAPSHGLKSSSYARPAEADAMPDRWLVTVYPGAAAARSAPSAQIRRPLYVGPSLDPAGQPPNFVTDPTGLKLDPQMRWLVDFDEALKAGMAVEIDISAQEAQTGFDRIVVVGLRASSAQSGGEELARIIDGHHFSEGFAFVPQGTQTNNTSDGRAGYSSADSGYRSFDVERLDPLVQRDGAVLAGLLGLPGELFEHIEASDRTDQANARAMAVALWGPTLGYFLLQMMDDVFSPAQEDSARAYFLDNVRGRGPLPAIRVADTLYGILPSSTLAKYKPERAPLQGLSSFLSRLLPHWLASAAGAPHITIGGDPDQELVAVLGQDASARSYRIRDALGSRFAFNYMRFLRLGNTAEWLRDAEQSGRQELTELGHPEWDPRLIHLALTQRDFPFPGPIVANELSETDPLPAAPGATWNYIAWLRNASIADIRAERYPGGTPPDALLYKVLRQALLIEYANQAYGALVNANLIDVSATKDSELVGFTQAAAGPTRAEARLRPASDQLSPWDALDESVPGVTAPGQTIGDYLRTPAGTGAFPRIGDLVAALDALALLPSAELERLFTETTDLCSTRVDAWITSLTTDRLLSDRVDAPTGLYLGCFGFVHDVRPEPAQPTLVGIESQRVNELDKRLRARDRRIQQLPPVRQPREDNGGFIHAPSVGQAAAAAVLRQGYLTHRQRSNGQLLAIDLSSKRVRSALWLLDGVRQGQSLATLLGYTFEQALHDTTPLAQYIEAFRLRYPLQPPDRLTPPQAPGPSDVVPLPNVINGLDLQRGWAGGLIPWSDLGVGNIDRARIEPLLRDLDDLLDALGDLSIAESVFQITRGNFGRADGMLEALVRGERAAEPDVVRTPRGGVAINYRLLLLFLDEPTRPAAWPQVGTRANIEPRLDAWLSQILPHPDAVCCQITHVHNGNADMSELKLSDLDLGPLDLLALADAADQPQASELEQRILFRALQDLPEAHGEVTIQFGRDAQFSPARTFPELLALLRAARDLIGGARPLTPEDLIEPGLSPFDHGANLHANDLRTTALDAITDIQTTRTTLENAAAANAIRTALIAASEYGVAGSIPASAKGSAALPDLTFQRDQIAAELKRRHEAAAALEAAYQDDPNRPDASVKHSLELLQLLFGESFIACAQFAPSSAATLQQAFNDSTTLLDGTAHEPERWLQRLSHVRSAVARFDCLQALTEIVSSTPRSEPTLAQLPPKTGPGHDRWLALPLNGSTPEAGRFAITAWIHDGQYDHTKLHAGLMLDQWVERIPSSAETTALAFHYTQPRARAPQSLLLAVSPDRRKSWDEQLLLEIVNETIDLARVRTVDLDALTVGGQLLPALYFAFNTAGDTVSANLKTGTTQQRRGI
jgi:hypothetical protein